MAKLKTPKSVKAWDELMAWAPDPINEGDLQEFTETVDNLIWEIQNETELAMMRGETRHLGEKHMLLSSVYTALSMFQRPVQREASFLEFKQALDRYLGIQLSKPSSKRQRRKLLLDS